MKKIFFSFFLLILFIGCSNKINPPKWYNNSHISKNSYILYGTGEGLSKQSAINYALNQIAAQIHTSISSEVYISKSQNEHNKKINFSKTVEQTIKQKIENFNVYNYKILKLKKVKNIYFTLVSVNKIELANIIYKKNADKLNNLKDNFKNADYLHKFKIAQKEIQLIKKGLIPSLYISYFLGKKDALEVINSAQKYLNVLNTFSNKFNISIQNGNYKHLLDDLLTQKGIHIANNSLIKISLRCKNKEFKYFNYYISKLKCNLEIKNKNDILFSNGIKVAGKSLLNYQISKSLAEIKLKKELNSIFNQLF